MKQIIAVLLMVGAISCQRAEPEMYLIRTGFTGQVTILFNQDGHPVKYKNAYNRDTIYLAKLGSPEKYEGGRRVYEIPADGVLLTQFKGAEGFIDREYFLVDSNNKRIPLKVFKYDYDKNGAVKWIIKNSAEVGIFGDGTSGSYGNMNIPFEEFIVSNFNQLDSFYTTDYKSKIDRKIEELTGLTLILNKTR